MASDEQSSRGRIALWHRQRNTVAIGNLGEQITLRVLHRAGYHIVATQEDLRSGIANILGIETRINAEDFVCVTPDDRLVTVNSKAAVSRRTTGLDRAGNLKRPRIPKSQATATYTTLRAGLISPVEGDVDGQLLKVDLALMLAQLFDIGVDGRPSARPGSEDVTDDVIAVLKRFPDLPPAPPSAFDVDDL
jgi:hypothetical protein